MEVTTCMAGRTCSLLCMHRLDSDKWFRQQLQLSTLRPLKPGCCSLLQMCYSVLLHWSYLPGEIYTSHQQHYHLKTHATDWTIGILVVSLWWTHTHSTTSTWPRSCGWFTNRWCRPIDIVLTSTWPWSYTWFTNGWCRPTDILLLTSTWPWSCSWFTNGWCRHTDNSTTSHWPRSWSWFTNGWCRQQTKYCIYLTTELQLIYQRM